MNSYVKILLLMVYLNLALSATLLLILLIVLALLMIATSHYIMCQVVLVILHGIRCAKDVMNQIVYGLGHKVMLKVQRILNIVDVTKQIMSILEFVHVKTAK